MTTRRGFITSILALGVAPAVVRADSLMRIVPRETRVLTVNNGDWLIDASGTMWTDITEAARKGNPYIISAHFTPHYLDLRTLLEASKP